MSEDGAPPLCPNCNRPCDGLIIYFEAGDMAHVCSKCDIHSQPFHIEKSVRMRIAREIFGAWAGVG